MSSPRWMFSLSLTSLVLTAGACDRDTEDDLDPVVELPGFESQVVEANGTQINVVTGGEGAPIVLIHGWPQSWYEWHRIMPGLAESRTVIAVDLRGIGGSAPSESGYDKFNLAEDLHQVVDALGYETVDVVGHDIGGMVALAWAFSYPDEVESAMIMDVPIPGLDPWAVVEGLAWHFGLHRAADRIAETLVMGHQAEYFAHFYEDFSIAGSPFGPEEVEIFAEAYSTDAQLSAGFEFYRAFSQDEEDFLALSGTALTTPIMYVGGESSLGPFLPVVQDSLLNLGATDVQTFVVEGSGHWVADEQPEIIESLVLDFTQ